MLGRLPIRWRLTLFQTVAMALIVVGLILAMYALIGSDRERRLRDHVQECARTGQRVIENEAGLRGDALVSANCGDISYAVLDEDGIVLAEIGSGASIGESFPVDFWRQALETGNPTGTPLTGNSLVANEPRYAWAQPLTAGNTPARVIVASIPYTSIGTDSVFVTSTIVAGVAIFVLIVILISSYLLVRSSLAPVNAITNAARQISGTDLSRRLPVENPRDELGRLSATFNELLGRLEGAFTQRERMLEQQRRFVADASHELRTPLTSILGYTRMLRDWGLDNPDTAREGLAALEHEAERMHRLVESLLRIARGDELPTVRLEPQDLIPIVQNAVDAARAFAGEMPGIVAALPDESVIALVDRVALMQAIEILIDNAVKHGQSTRPVTLTLSTTATGPTIEVRDTGIGIAPEHVPHLFERFYRVDTARAIPGSGLGLPIAQQIVTQHGGSLKVDTAPGRGTTFTIRLPKSRPD